MAIVVAMDSLTEAFITAAFRQAFIATATSSAILIPFMPTSVRSWPASSTIVVVIFSKSGIC